MTMTVTSIAILPQLPGTQITSNWRHNRFRTQLFLWPLWLCLLLYTLVHSEMLSHMKFGSHVKCALFCTDLNHKKKLVVRFKYQSAIKSHTKSLREDSCSMRRRTDGRRDGRTDMTKLIRALLD